jgi:S1-C subfamily serine protease
MPEGLFYPEQLAIPTLSLGDLTGAMVRILPKTKLVFDLVDDPSRAGALARNELLPDGTECWYRFFTREDVARVHDPEFAMGMVRHEFSRLVKEGTEFPATTWLDGGGSGFCFDRSGLILTNFHLVTGEVALHRRESGVIGEEVLCRSLRAEVARPDSQGQWQWHPATRLWLVSNPPRERSLSDDGAGLLHPLEDTAVLRIEPSPRNTLSLSDRQVKLGETIFMAGFPLRTARTEASKLAVGYSDADGTLRVSTGVITDIEAPNCFTSDIDGSMGNSGSPAFDRAGNVVGIFSRSTGNGPRNAFEYGQVRRVFVSAGLAISGLELNGAR